MRGHLKNDWRSFGVLTISTAGLSSMAKDLKKKGTEEGAEDRGRKVRVQRL